MINLPSNIFDRFRAICKKDIDVYFNGILAFMQTDYVAISSYYSGQSTTITPNSFKNLEYYTLETATILSLFDQFRHQMNNLIWWDLLDQVESIDNRLKTLNNINRWARASTAKVGYYPTVQFQHVLKQNETLERVSQDVLGSTDPMDDWYNIAVNNDLIEEGYTESGGAVLKLTAGNGFSTSFQINSVVDMIAGQTVLGKDVYKNMEIDPVAQDLVVLDYKDTIMQAITILATLKKNDNPDFPTHGIQKSVLVGSNRVSFNFPLITRQMSETFATDDSLKNFNIGAYSFDQDNLCVNFTVQNRLGETMDLQVQLT